MLFGVGTEVGTPIPTLNLQEVITIEKVKKMFMGLIGMGSDRANTL